MSCLGCNNFNFKNWKRGASCKAFPKGIPRIIANGEVDHSKPLPDQGNDIVFEPIEEKPKE